ncbi:unnamed protein product [Arabidopsis lyrata]|nr:unnamed protein product [Arabidopsis lyrata]
MTTLVYRPPWQYLHGTLLFHGVALRRSHFHICLYFIYVRIKLADLILTIGFNFLL